MRLTTDKKVHEMGIAELAYNGCYVENGKARYRDHEIDVDARALARILSITLAKKRLPESDEQFDEKILDDLQYSYFTDIRGLIALFYRNLWAMADLREMLKYYEDREEQRLAAGICIKAKCESDFCKNETVSGENEAETMENDTENVADAAEILNEEADGRLTKCDNIGNWGVKGLSWEELQIGQVITSKISEKLYGCLCKLKDYEKTGLSPEEVERLVEERR